MKAKIHIVTIGTKNFAAMLAFYRDGLAWPVKVSSGGEIAFFTLSGLVLAICNWNVLQDDAGICLHGATPAHITLAQNVGSEAEVDEAFQQAEKAGAKIAKPPQKASWGGYSGYFADPDGNLWEVAWNPFFPFDENDNLVMPD